MEEVEKVENEEVEETKEDEFSNESENQQLETKEESYSKSDIDSKFILFEDRIRAYINEVLNSKNETTNENDEQQKERNWD